MNTVNTIGISLKSRLEVCLITCSILLAMLISGNAQQRQNEEEKGGKGFRVTLFNDWEGPQLFVKVKKSYVELEAHKMAYTQTFRYSAAEPIVLYSEQTNDEGEVEFMPFIKFAVGKEIIEPLLVLSWQAESKKGAGKILEFSPKRFGYGHYQIVNLSGVKIGGYIGDKKKVFSCDPMSEYISRYKYENGLRTPIAVYTTVSAKPSLVFSTLTIHRVQKRVILFLNAEKNKLGRLVYRSQSLVDFKVEEE